MDCKSALAGCFTTITNESSISIVSVIRVNSRNSFFPDSIQVATAVYSSADYFLTNDIRLRAVKEIEILILDELIKK